MPSISEATHQICLTMCPYWCGVASVADPTSTLFLIHTLARSHQGGVDRSKLISSESLNDGGIGEADIIWAVRGSARSGVKTGPPLYHLGGPGGHGIGGMVTMKLAPGCAEGNHLVPALPWMIRSCYCNTSTVKAKSTVGWPWMQDAQGKGSGPGLRGIPASR